MTTPATIHEIAESAELKAATLLKLEQDLEDYFILKAEEEAAKTKAAALKPGIVAALSKYGSVPDGAPKSRRIETAAYVSTVTTPTNSEIDDEAVDALRTLLGKTAKLRGAFTQMFRSRTEYTLEPGARDVVLHTNWPRALKEAVLPAYIRCHSAKTGNPSLTVESKFELAAKQRKAEEEAEAKAVAQAAKKSRKVAA